MMILEEEEDERKGVLSLITPRIATVVAASADVNSDCGDVICENAETYMSPVPRSKEKINSDCGDVICENAETYMSPVPRSKEKIAEFVKELQGRIRIINLERRSKEKIAEFVKELQGRIRIINLERKKNIVANSNYGDTFKFANGNKKLIKSYR
ncbi:hypothetical protein QE152_g24606 [Popillia japonica]|uniref:Uncharacterized protein n=1 Tax=Popillia japonica TaxID=7064 RepID=A0AAW1K4Z6_POPJA